MKMYIFLEGTNHIEYVTPFNPTPLFIVIIILLLAVIVLLLLYLIKIRKENKLAHAEDGNEDFSLINQGSQLPLKSDDKMPIQSTDKENA